MDRFLTLLDYERFLKTVQTTHKIVPLHEYKMLVENGEKSIAGLRHDIDYSLTFLKGIVKVEQALGVCSTIFLPSFRSNIPQGDEWSYLKSLEEVGFEIGLHYATITEYLTSGFQRTQKEILESSLNRLRKVFNVKGCSSHGDDYAKKYGYVNYLVFKEGADSWRRREGNEDVTAIDVFGLTPNPVPIGELSLADVGLEYEAYLLPMDGYVSDCSKFDYENYVDNLLSMVGPGDNVEILIHPIRWQLSRELLHRSWIFLESDE